MTTDAAPSILQNPKVLGLAAGTLFALGLMSFALLYTNDAPSVASVRLAAGTGLLVGMGYPMMLYVGTLRKIAELEARLASLETRTR